MTQRFFCFLNAKYTIYQFVNFFGYFFILKKNVLDHFVFLQNFWAGIFGAQEKFLLESPHYSRGRIKLPVKLYITRCTLY